jgi:dienelactone hydrolase
LNVGRICKADAARPQAVDYGRPGRFDVGTLDVTFTDSSRPIQANAKHPAEPARVLPGTIYYPAAGGALLGSPKLAAGGPFPLLVHSHGYGSNRSEGAHIGERAASHGYVVVAVDFPFTKTDRLLSGESVDTSDIINQAGDVSFVIDQLNAFSRDTSHVLANAVDAERIGVTGVSMGGLTTLLVTFHPKVRDKRIRAAVPIAPLSSFFMPEFYHTADLPVLVISGDLDAFIDYELNARRSFARAAPNAQLVTLARGTHAAFATQFDAVTLALMNSLFAPADADPANVDAFGCAATGETLRNDSDYLAPLGGKQSFVDYDAVHEPWLPCSGDEYRHPGMDSSEQSELATRATQAFFEAHLGRTPELQEQGCRYLTHELPKHPAVQLE